MKLTAQAVARLRREGSLPFRDIKDEGAPGLYLRILKSGGKRWLIRYKIAGATRVATVGDASDVALAEARAKASAWRALVREGRDPALEDRRKRAEERRLPTVAAFAAEYIARHAQANKRSWRLDERLLKRSVLPKIGDMRIDAVRRRDIALMLDSIRDRGVNIEANRALAVTRRLFAFGVERGAIEATPFVGIRASRETPRARILTDAEVRLLWARTALDATRIAPQTRMALRLMLLTGARTGEVCAASWGEIDAEAKEWIFPAARTKNGREHRVPLSDLALEVIGEAAGLKRGGWLLPSPRGAEHVTPSAALEAVQRILGDTVVAHDLRRTVATGLQRLGVRLEVKRF
jgi:integrase